MVVRAVVLTKLAVLGIVPIRYFILALRAVVVALRVVLVVELQISGISSSIFFNLVLYTSYLTTPIFYYIT